MMKQILLELLTAYRMGKLSREAFEKTSMKNDSHRYVPMLNYADPPVISTVGRDTVCYGATLEDYLLRDFCTGNTAFAETKTPYILLWSDILESVK